ncbi:MAG: hypothetical protein COT28_21255 [Methylobacterium sp. CG08_land_8_20_14_0_20_71_15]|nr:MULTISPECIES: hypothetical protein [Methylobacterium]PIU04882.1 MAG: hypothetical protein COT56_17860 [Methylobacterium sp. CG09_land_8_20_14_0_10_71_15]PIU11210.1 MAG: hypothetical protein COT28_21255 [Methylobacterium sp. CG08_land_8_20_14_0_20_71_15]
MGHDPGLFLLGRVRPGDEPGAVDADEEPAHRLDGVGLVQEPDVVDDHALALAPGPLDLGPGEPEPDVAADALAAPLGPDGLHDVPGGAAEAGDLLLLPAAVDAVEDLRLGQAGRAQERRRHALEGRGEALALVAVLALQDAGEGALPGAGQADDADQAGQEHQDLRKRSKARRQA